MLACYRESPSPNIANDADAWRGAQLFDACGCPSCHTPTFVTGDSDVPELAHQTIHPFTDLLLHDLGDGHLVICSSVGRRRPGSS